MTKARVNADNASADIQGVTAGTGLTGGGTSGTVTLDVDTTTIQARVANVTDTEIGYLDGVSSAIQTQLNDKINNTLTTTTGDIIYASGANTPARLGIGSSGQILSVSGGVPAWAAAPSAGANWSLLSSTSLSGSTTTITGISGKDKIMVLVDQASGNTGGESVGIRVNTDTASNYNYFGQRAVAGSTYSNGNYTGTGAGSDNNMAMFNMGSTAGSVGFGSCMITGCNAAGIKIFQTVGGANGTNAGAYATGGYYTGTSVISSVSVFMSGGTFDAGTVRVYTSA